MNHPDFTKGFKEQISAARKYYNGRNAAVTGPDGRPRKAIVISTVIDEGLSYEWVVMVHFEMERLDGHPDKFEDLLTGVNSVSTPVTGS